jgi:homoserine dehydrogenase
MSHQETNTHSHNHPALQPPIVVLKLGSSVLRGDADLPRVVDEIFAVLRSGSRALCVVSAMGDTTDHLLSRAKTITGQPAGGTPNDGRESAAFAQLLATGETASTALLTLALQRAGIDACGLEATTLGLKTRGPLLNATPFDVDEQALQAAFARSAVVVVPGFVGQHPDGRTSLLGRGGTDLTALYLAHVLRADRCVLLKDVDGIYDEDPKRRNTARRYATLNAEHATRDEAKVLQGKAARFAQRHAVDFDVKAIGSSGCTRVRNEATCLAEDTTTHTPLRVVLLGLGTVGRGVYERLRAEAERFDIVALAVREPAKHSVLEHALHDDAERAAEVACDVVVELIGGIHPSYDIARRVLRAGRHFVTANKALIATHGKELRALARRHGGTLAYSASVGGAVPVLETLASLPSGSVTSIEGVLNGTTNFVLDQVAGGASFDDAVRAAQDAGFAEADPTLDLDGTDVAQKLAIAAYSAWLYDVDASAIPRQGLDPRSCAPAATHVANGRRLRLVARCALDGLTVRASIGLRALPAEHLLAQLRDEENAVVLGLSNGSDLVLRGKGAGRWPTTQAVIGDLLSLPRTRRRPRLALAV